MIREEIQRRGLSYSEAAKISGIDPAQVRRFCLKERKLTSEAVDRLASALGLWLVKLDQTKGLARDLEQLQGEWTGAVYQAEELIKKLQPIVDWAKRRGYSTSEGPELD